MFVKNRKVVKVKYLKQLGEIEAGKEAKMFESTAKALMAGGYVKVVGEKEVTYTKAEEAKLAKAKAK